MQWRSDGTALNDRKQDHQHTSHAAADHGASRHVLEASSKIIDGNHSRHTQTNPLTPFPFSPRRDAARPYAR